jgi:hypothetical protein
VFGLKRLVVLFVVCVLVLSGLTVAVRADSEADAQSAIFGAEQRVLACYNAVANAGKEGANTSALLVNLTEAGNLLSRADLAFEKGDFNSGQAFALQSQQRLEGFEAQADSLGQKAAHDRFVDFEVNVVGSLVGTAVVVLGAFTVWFALKRRYKPEG